MVSIESICIGPNERLETPVTIKSATTHDSDRRHIKLRLPFVGPPSGQNYTPSCSHLGGGTQVPSSCRLATVQDFAILKSMP
jgi:hypothetical protein